MSTTPTVSVVIPAYKAAPFIGETLDSVFKQSFTDYEVIIVNDGSPDTPDLERVLQPYMNRIRYIKQKNLGAAAARNEGLRAAKSGLIAFLDSDDLWLPEYLDQQLKFLREQDCDLVCADADVFGDAPDAGGTYMENLMASAPPTGQVSFLELVSSERSLITSGVVARRDLIFKVGLFDEALRNAQDFDLWLRLAHSGARLAYQRHVLLRYRTRANSLTGDATNSLIRELRVLDKIQHSYNLTAEERAEVFPVIRSRQAILQFELGKHLVARGDIEPARTAFSKADRSRRSWKTQTAIWFSRLAPGPMQALCLRRLQPKASDAGGTRA
ncbi:MAG TPA: glycosyltransferase family A protein [Pyrinomonadaceae bacterium]|nr:glycosyltransferase family A protein [Pyrinomonadaceae bacterium]